MRTLVNINNMVNSLRSSQVSIRRFEMVAGMYLNLVSANGGKWHSLR